MEYFRAGEDFSRADPAPPSGGTPWPVTRDPLEYPTFRPSHIPALSLRTSAFLSGGHSSGKFSRANSPNSSTALRSYALAASSSSSKCPMKMDFPFMWIVARHLPTLLSNQTPLNRDTAPAVLARFRWFSWRVQTRRLIRQLFALLPSMWSTTMPSGGFMISRCMKIILPFSCRAA